MAYFFRHSLWFASLALCFAIGLHFSIIQAKHLAHAHLSTPLVLALAGCSMAGTVVCYACRVVLDQTRGAKQAEVTWT